MQKRKAMRKRRRETQEEAEVRRDMAMTPEQRVQKVIELRNRAHPGLEHMRMARVYRVIDMKTGKVLKSSPNYPHQD